MTAPRFCPPPESAVARRLWPIIRVPASGTLEMICWSDEPIGTWVHFVRGRTQPCTQQDDCPHCLSNLDRRYEAYVWAQCAITAHVKILALPSLAAHWLVNEVCKVKSLNGRILKLKRVGKSKRSQIKITVHGQIPPDHPDKRLPRLDLVLVRIWGTGDPNQSVEP